MVRTLDWFKSKRKFIKICLLNTFWFNSFIINKLIVLLQELKIQLLIQALIKLQLSQQYNYRI
jgi:alpha/beta superfamily hydrolase